MKKVSFVLIFILLAVFFIAPGYIGFKIESGFNAYLHSADIVSLRKYGIRLSLKQYKRGYFSSDATVKLVIINPADQSLLLATELKYDITHAPLILSGFNLADIKMTNSSHMDGEFSNTLPSVLVDAHMSANLLGYIEQNINVSPFSVKSASFALKNIEFGGANMHWTSHLNDFPQKGHGSLNTPFIRLHNQFDQAINIDGLMAKLAIQDNERVLTIDHLKMDYQLLDKQTVKLTAENIEQIQQLTRINNQYIPLSRTLTVSSADLALNNITQLNISNIHSKLGLQQSDNSYQFVFDWNAHLAVSPNVDNQQFPWLATLPAEQDLSVSFAPINDEQLAVWANTTELIWQPSLPIADSLARLNQLLRLNIAEQHMQLKLLTTLKDNNALVFKANILIDENIDSAQKINTIIHHGINPHWFYDSHADITINRSYLKKMNLLPFIVLFYDKGLEFDDKGYVHWRARIVNQQLIFNNKITN